MDFLQGRLDCFICYDNYINMTSFQTEWEENVFGMKNIIYNLVEAKVRLREAFDLGVM